MVERLVQLRKEAEMHLKDANELLDNFYLPFESG